ncbi:hypothetical protein KUV51_05755 [Tateyamaria omphalii]|uniref:hypothetical protein n=1 Tax=Tateyamaria omphalii TaxID=299262 RepID=UPI001C992DBC|nr:hypothetical protein [Tateyamaria omphalii]MBY5932498.1 hypothetical protein [Tateyamaria omphalii]
MSDGGDNTEWHARIGPPDQWAQKKANAFYGAAVFGTLGALLFAFIGHLLLPDWFVEFGFLGFLAGAAGYVKLAARFAKRFSKDEYAKGNSRTDEEVRQALADIQARRK